MSSSCLSLHSNQRVTSALQAELLGTPFYTSAFLAVDLSFRLGDQSHYQASSRTPISRTCRTLQSVWMALSHCESRLVDLSSDAMLVQSSNPDPDDHDTGARRQLLVAALLSIPQYVSIHRHSINNFLLIPCTWLTMLKYVKMLLHFRSTGSIRKYNTTKAMGHQSLLCFFKIQLYFCLLNTHTHHHLYHLFLWAMFIHFPRLC